jgi:hypothetical protein
LESLKQGEWKGINKQKQYSVPSFEWGRLLYIYIYIYIYIYTEREREREREREKGKQCINFIQTAKPTFTNNPSRKADLRTWATLEFKKKKKKIIFKDPSLIKLKIILIFFFNKF